MAYMPTLRDNATTTHPHCADCASAPVNTYGLRRAHCATCGVLCYDVPDAFEQNRAYCSGYCQDVAYVSSQAIPLDSALAIMRTLTH